MQADHTPLSANHTPKKLTREINIRMVEKQHLHFTPIIGINDTGTSINEMLRGKTAARCHATICDGKKEKVSN